MELRDYQKECIDKIQRLEPGSYLVQMCTGLGKTVTFANIPRRGRVLILSHREELVNQPRKYYDCSYGIEQGVSHSNGEDVVSASVQSISRRLENFAPDEFDTIICDEAHHAAAKSYRKIFDYFTPRLLLGFTATPKRGDKVRLDDVFSKIIFQRDLRWGIENGYLCEVFCKRIKVGYDLSSVHTRHGDYVIRELDMAMEGTADAIAEVYRKHAVGATLIFAVSVRQCHEIADRIPGAVTVTGDTEDRAAIIKDFTEGRIPCIVNCMVFTEGTDIPLVETVIVARPTQSETLYQQMVGRGMRLYPGKERLTLIDCVGVTGKVGLCTAPSLLGIDLSNIPEGKRDTLQGDLFGLPMKAVSAADCPESWIRNVEIVDLMVSEQGYDTHDINFFKMPGGEMTVSLSGGKRLTVPAPDILGNVTLKDGAVVKLQEAFDMAYWFLNDKYSEQRSLWDLRMVKKWANQPPTEKQLCIIKKKCRGFDTSGLTKGQASMILNRLLV